MESLRDAVDRWIEFATELARNPADSSLVPRVLDLLHDSYDCAAEWTIGSEDGQVGWVFRGAPPGWPEPGSLDYAAAHLGEHPISRWFTHTGNLDPMTSGRVPSSVADCRLAAAAQEMLGPEMRRELVIPIRMTPRGRGAFVLLRGGNDFSDEHLNLARRIQPMLVVLDRLTHPALREAAPVQQMFGLTTREVSVLSLLRQGHTRTAIGHRLSCSPRTVDKHLERIYRKLEVQDRLGAIRRVETHLPPPALTTVRVSSPTHLQDCALRPDLLVLSARVPASQHDDKKGPQAAKLAGGAAMRTD